MDPTSYIDLYCERTAFGFWNEPFNALSNVSFLIATFFAARVALARPRRDLPELVVITLAGLIGIGSFAFHTLATTSAELADVIPIWTFVTLFIVLVIYRATGQNGVRTARIAAIAASITAVVFWFTAGDITTEVDSTRSLFNGSLQYAPALIALVIFAGLTARRNHPAHHYIAAAAFVFFVSLVFRSIDFAVCDATVIGTHFLWHLLNGLMVGILLMALVRYFPPLTK